MAFDIAIIFIVITIFGWGFGDFFIQKSTRKVGDWETLFLLTATGAVVLTPFVYKNLEGLFIMQPFDLLVMIIASLALFLAAILNLEALKRGKLSIIEPVWAIEIPAAGVLAFLLVSESPGWPQIFMIISLIIGLVLVSFRNANFSKEDFLEKGVIIALIGAITMGAASFLIGVGSRATNALIMNWFFNIFLAIGSLIFILARSNVKKLTIHFRKQKYTWLGMCVFDNAAWIAFAAALIIAPIMIVAALADTCIVVSVLLGVYVNKEVLQEHQKGGIILAVIAAIILALALSGIVL